MFVANNKPANKHFRQIKCTETFKEFSRLFVIDRFLSVPHIRLLIWSVEPVMKRPQKLEKFNLIVLWKKKKRHHKRNLASLIMLGFPNKKKKHRLISAFSYPLTVMKIACKMKVAHGRFFLSKYGVPTVTTRDSSKCVNSDKLGCGLGWFYTF